jgi:GNAT superfamily N-acetyltransferase
VAFGRPRGDRFWLYALAVDPAERRAGVGRRLLRGLPGDRIEVPPLLPDDWPAAVAFLSAAGGERGHHVQWEMARPVGPASPQSI